MSLLFDEDEGSSSTILGETAGRLERVFRFP
jgi:hypothetical protein